MTKEKLRRLIALSNQTALFRADEEAEELLALQAEFEAWDPEQGLNRWKQEFKSYAVHDDARCEHFKKCQCGLADLLKEAGLAE